MSTELFDSLKPNFKGDIDYSPTTLKTYSHDASLFEIVPKVVVFPKDTEDIKTLVKWVNENRAKDPILSITARSAGTDMSGGAINASIIMDFTKYMNKIKEVNENFAVVEPGCYYRDFDKETQKINRMMPSYTASREICAVGGMVANNSGGEKSIKYGKTELYLKQLKVVLTDGNEYTVVPLTLTELKKKMKVDTFEGNLYKKLFELIDTNYDKISAAKPTVSKNSSGYYLWNVYDKANKTFDLCRLIVGSQGTLAIITEISFKLVPTAPYADILAVFLPNLASVSELVTEIMPFQPDSLETYDDYSMKLAVTFFFDFFKQLGFYHAIKLGFQFIPEAWMMMTGGVPKLILMIEVSGQNEKEVLEKLTLIEHRIAHFGDKMHIAKNSAEAEKYWRIRRESFNLLRKHVHNRRTAPFIDDIIVKPELLPEFMPKLQKILEDYKLTYTIAGHLGNGNFHIIPLMDLNSPFSSDAILEISQKVYALVHEYGGSNSAEHNDGIIRTPYLLQQFGPEIIEYFQETKNIFDPTNILNPGKKVGGTFDDIKKYIMKKN